MPQKSANGLNVKSWRDLLTHDGAFAVDSSQEIVYWGPSAERILGYRAQDVAGKHCYDILGGKDAEDYLVCRRDCPIIASARRGRPTPDYDLLCAVAGGEHRWLNVSIVVSRENRNTFQVLHLFRDVSSRRRVEEFARKASAALQQLLKGGDGGLEEQAGEPATPLPRLSKRELEVLRLLAAGVTTEQIAEALAIHPLTARNHVSRLLTKLGVRSRLQAVVYASRKRLI